LDVRLGPRAPYPILTVRNPVRQTAYEVRLPEYPAEGIAFCGCPDFGRRGIGTCKHIEAARLWLEENPFVAPTMASLGERPRAPMLWKEIDRRIARARTTKGRRSIAWRSPGAVLLESGRRERAA
jgi:hypothetical protein